MGFWLLQQLLLLVARWLRVCVVSASSHLIAAVVMSNVKDALDAFIGEAIPRLRAVCEGLPAPSVGDVVEAVEALAALAWPAAGCDEAEHVAVEHHSSACANVAQFVGGVAALAALVKERAEAQWLDGHVEFMTEVVDAVLELGKAVFDPVLITALVCVAGGRSQLGPEVTNSEGDLKKTLSAVAGRGAALTAFFAIWKNAAAVVAMLSDVFELVCVWNTRVGPFVAFADHLRALSATEPHVPPPPPPPPPPSARDTAARRVYKYFGLGADEEPHAGGGGGTSVLDLLHDLNAAPFNLQLCEHKFGGPEDSRREILQFFARLEVEEHWVGDIFGLLSSPQRLMRLLSERCRGDPRTFNRVVDEGLGPKRLDDLLAIFPDYDAELGGWIVLDGNGGGSLGDNSVALIALGFGALLRPSLRLLWNDEIVQLAKIGAAVRDDAADGGEWAPGSLDAFNLYDHSCGHILCGSTVDEVRRLRCCKVCSARLIPLT